MGERVHFSDHAAWRAAERHGESVSLDILEEEIGWSISAGWWQPTAYDSDDIIVTTREGDRFVLRPTDNGHVVLTSLGRNFRDA